MMASPRLRRHVHEALETAWRVGADDKLFKNPATLAHQAVRSAQDGLRKGLDMQELKI
jgi:hypothetical protein